MGTDSKFHRRRPGVGWVLALVVVPLVLALIGWAVSSRTTDTAGTATAPGVVPPASSAASTAPPAPAGTAKYGDMAIVRTGNGFTLTGVMPDAALKDSLATSLKQAMPGARIDDQLTIRPGVEGPEFSGLGGLFGSAVDIPGFSATLANDTVTLAGTAPSLVDKAAAEASVKSTWPDAVIANDIRVGAAGGTSAPPPAPAAAGGCGTLQADVDGLLRTPVTFATNGFTLEPASARLLDQVAAKIKACPTAKISVVGYTDDAGSDRVNQPLSASRAKSVADALTSDGIAGVTSRGAGSANPLADNGTDAGRAQNRRVEITVG